MAELIRLLKNNRRDGILAPTFKLLEATFELLVPLVVAAMIDAGTADGHTGWQFALLLLMSLVGFGCTVVAQFFAARASSGAAGALRQRMFERIGALSFSQLDRLGGDTLITRLTDDVNQIQNGLNLGLRLLLRSPFIVFGAMVMAFTIDLRCALIFAVTIPLLFAVVYGIMLLSIPLFGRAQAGLDRVTAMTRENLTGVRVIRAFRREKRSVEEFEQSSRTLTKLNLFVGRISAAMNPLTYLMINLATVLLIRKAGLQVELGALRRGQAVALYNYMLQIIVELVKMASLIITLNRSAACARRAAELMNTQPSMQYPARDTAPADSAAPAVEFEDVSFRYDGAGADCLSHISFSAQPGQTVGIIGGTGSGKSSLISLIPRFYDVSSGAVRLEGRDVRTLSRETLCREVGVVPQKAVLFSGTIRENLQYGCPTATDDELWRALELAQAKQVVQEKPGALDFIVEQGGRNLSGGQRQRLTIARALVMRPKILILDDSSSALDYATDAALRRALASLRSETTTFLVSQRIACVRGADLILVLDNGSLVGMGTHESLQASCAVYREICASQLTKGEDGHE